MKVHLLVMLIYLVGIFVMYLIIALDKLKNPRHWNNATAYDLNVATILGCIFWFFVLLYFIIITPFYYLSVLADSINTTKKERRMKTYEKLKKEFEDEY